MEEKKSIWNRKGVLLATACFCCALWGSAFPCIKVGYRIFSIAQGDAASQLLFAGLRFFLAGILALAFGSLLQRKWLLPHKSTIGPIAALATFQTVGQYIFFYIGMAHAVATRASILNGAGTFITIIIAVFIFRYEKLTTRKIAGCLVGFAGVVLIETAGQTVDIGFALNGEGFILISMVSGGIATNMIKRFSQKENPVVLSGCQFMLGGLVLTVLGLLGGGRMIVPSAASLLLLLYMAFISSAAYTLWGILLKYNPVSLVSIFKFVTPVAGVLLSALILKEYDHAFSLYTILSLVLVCLGIVILFAAGGNGSKPLAKKGLSR